VTAPAASKHAADRGAGFTSSGSGAVVSVGAARAVRISAELVPGAGGVRSGRRSARRPGERSGSDARRSGASAGEPAAGGGTRVSPTAPVPGSPEQPADPPLGGALPLDLTSPGAGGGGGGAGTRRQPVRRLIEALVGSSPSAGGSGPAGAPTSPGAGAGAAAGSPVAKVGKPKAPESLSAPDATALVDSVGATVSGTLATTTKTLTGR